MSSQPIGPSLPPHWSQNKINNNIDNDQEEEDNILMGPILPPNYQFINNNKTINDNNDKSMKTTEIIGPKLPNHLKGNNYNDCDTDSNDSNEMIGPLPQTHQLFDKYNQKFINNPSIVSMNDKNEKEVTKREEWMTEIPKPLARKLGMKSVHQFSQKSSKNIDINNTNDDNNYSNDCKNKEMTEIMDSYKKRNKRNVSLLDIHREKLKKAKSEEKCKERQPFDPEKDLSVPKMDSKQRNSLIDSSKGFNDRFSLGTNKFL